MVSVILPNLNTDLKFIKPRVQSIINQTYTNWECIIVDGYSTNGSFEYLSNFVGKDERFKAYQKPRKGIYNAWNEGIKLAKGDYIYIATSDDTMHPDFLNKMVSALDQHPTCDLAHCCLEVINESDNLISDNNWSNYLPQQYFGELIAKQHIRYAPHDGFLYAFVKTVYHSVTQLLIRRKIFDDIGFFLEDEGSIADFEWGMRTSLFKNTFHVPEYLATWRVHPQQATQKDIHFHSATYKKLVDWVALNLNLFKKRSLSDFSSASIRELTQVYRQNKRYFMLQRLKKNNILAYKILKKTFYGDLRQTTGLKEAKQYFRVNKLDRLIKVIGSDQ